MFCSIVFFCFFFRNKVISWCRYWEMLTVSAELPNAASSVDCLFYHSQNEVLPGEDECWCWKLQLSNLLLLLVIVTCPQVGPRLCATRWSPRRQHVARVHLRAAAAGSWLVLTTTHNNVRLHHLVFHCVRISAPTSIAQCWRMPQEKNSS